MIFKKLDSIIKYNIKKKMEQIPYKKDVIIIKKEDTNNISWYLIKKICCSLNWKDIRILKENSVFGMLALILKKERTLDVIIGENFIILN